MISNASTADALPDVLVLRGKLRQESDEKSDGINKIPSLSHSTDLGYESGSSDSQPKSSSGSDSYMLSSSSEGLKENSPSMFLPPGLEVAQQIKGSFLAPEPTPSTFDDEFHQATDKLCAMLASLEQGTELSETISQSHQAQTTELNDDDNEKTSSLKNNVAMFPLPQLAEKTDAEAWLEASAFDSAHALATSVAQQALEASSLESAHELAISTAQQAAAAWERVQEDFADRQQFFNEAHQNPMEKTLGGAAIWWHADDADWRQMGDADWQQAAAHAQDSALASCLAFEQLSSAMWNQELLWHHPQVQHQSVLECVDQPFGDYTGTPQSVRVSGDRFTAFSGDGGCAQEFTPPRSGAKNPAQQGVRISAGKPRKVGLQGGSGTSTKQRKQQTPDQGRSNEVAAAAAPAYVEVGLQGGDAAAMPDPRAPAKGSEKELKPRQSQHVKECPQNNPTMRHNLRELENLDHSRIVLVRKINRLGMKSPEFLEAHYSQYGKVEQVLAPHSHVKLKGGCGWRLRPTCLGFIVMSTAAEAEAILAAGPEQQIRGGLPGAEEQCVTISVKCFQQRISGDDSDEE
jgi:hypothetical protein